MIEVTGRFGQPHLSVASGGGFHGVGFLYLLCTTAAEGGVDPVFRDYGRVGCGYVRTVFRGLLWYVTSLRDGMGREGLRWN
ncbi:MAG: hypothetical protein C4B59_04705 [Candidatus Methanogaster sp.]|uniref:Uncharacterized protein n=1 Tax=Candidatus Methanogaster sp. TaxID=3386292 RepID=A0AC61L456_9EURY|nr:MAG: hypothetical protein C4B59_04705 [ANME-2 cluster archaeon]